jgi:hypothetical protein
MATISVPFKIKNVFEGFAESQGILRLDGESLSIEFQTKDKIVGVIKSKIKNIKVPVSNIEEVDFKKSVFGNTMTIRLSKLSEAENIPQKDLGEIKVSIDKKYIEVALDFVLQLKLEVADHRLKEAGK